MEKIKKISILVLTISIIILNKNLCFSSNKNVILNIDNKYKNFNVTNLPYYFPSTTQLYEVFYFVDEKFQDKMYDDPGIRNKDYYKGKFSNSATFNSSCDGLIRYRKKNKSF